jgi:hypothetical protein
VFCTTQEQDQEQHAWVGKHGRPGHPPTHFPSVKDHYGRLGAYAESYIKEGKEALLNHDIFQPCEFLFSKGLALFSQAITQYNSNPDPWLSPCQTTSSSRQASH